MRKEQLAMSNEQLTMSNYRYKAGLLLLFGMFICGTAAAQTGGQQGKPAAQTVRLSPDEAVEKAIKSNLSLESARVSASTKKRASDLSWNQFIPSVTVGGSLIMDNEKSTVSGMQPVDISAVPGISIPPKTLYGVVPYSVEAPQWHVAGSIQMSLNISIAMFENMNRLKLDYQSGLIAYDKAKLQLERDIRKAYNSMLLLQANIDLLKESYDAAGRRVQLARANYNAGLAPELTFLQAQVAMENMKPTMDQVENGYRLAKAQFAMLLGLPYDTLFEFVPFENAADFISLDVKDLISKSASSKPDIQELRHSILLLKSVRKVQTLSLLPALTLSWNTTPAFIGDPWKDNWGDNDLWKRSGSLTIMLGLRLNSLIPFSQDFQGIKSLDDQIAVANIGLAQMIRGTEIEIYNTVLALNKTQITAEAQKKTVELADRAYRLTEQAFRAGLQDLLQVQNAELELKQAKVSMLEQQFNYLNGLLDLEYSIGVPFGTLHSGAQ
ncbi:MAG: TolC family protein [Treponema sp.]|jgi:outer membrane protein TolC|nr:TolC family protein [Treponema sp.]